MSEPRLVHLLDCDGSAGIESALIDPGLYAVEIDFCEIYGEPDGSTCQYQALLLNSKQSAASSAY